MRKEAIIDDIIKMTNSNQNGHLILIKILINAKNNNNIKKYHYFSHLLAMNFLSQGFRKSDPYKIRVLGRLNLPKLSLVNLLNCCNEEAIYPLDNHQSLNV